jgi:hypothetical protein
VISFCSFFKHCKKYLMKNRLFALGIGMFFLVVFYSCQKEVGSDKVNEPTLRAASLNSLNAVAEECGVFRTQSPGGWGAPPNGGNPGAYLHANFVAAFPDGLSIGCYPGNFYVRFTSAQAITDYMPAGGKPQALANNYTDPSPNDLQNTLADHVIALSLSTGFDLYDPNFGPSEVNLGFMVVASGPFQGSSVSEVLAEANMALGGCGGNHTVAQIVSTLDQINNNFLDGTTDNGYLLCPGPRRIGTER